MSQTWLITHPSCLEHDTGPGHPESAQRLRAILRALEADEFAGLERREAAPATREQIERVHDADYVAATLDAIPAEGRRSLDGDTVVSAGSGEAALHAAGAGCQAVDAVLAGEARRVFCAVRPPGHHAEPAQAMGFCLFNNIAVAAAHARAAHGLQRVAVVDFDVHHGNGTQTMLAGRDGFMYASTHQRPLFPGTGRRQDNRENALYNIPLIEGCDSELFREHFHNEIISAIMRFEPDILLVSAGFDAHGLDPLAGLELCEADFHWATEELTSVADYTCGGRLVSMLEGGYHLDALASSTAAHVAALLGLRYDACTRAEPVA
ncbi:histone deacetylase family protein [Arhodomonas aquaeolei]|uniref:histone deacetylase family protein n=1 Tax=Arhodomonas aquaeolei TaxID=2369 RepID=UPI00036017BE|nr:histone deacetylase family protein [Arhodomonas aquaeolei]